MLIQSRPVAITMAVITFFGLSLASVFKGLAPATCCKRALIGAAIVYAAATLTAAVINAILTHAIIESHTNPPKGEVSPLADKQKGQTRVG